MSNSTNPLSSPGLRALIGTRAASAAQASDLLSDSDDLTPSSLDFAGLSLPPGRPSDALPSSSMLARTPLGKGSAVDEVPLAPSPAAAVSVLKSGGLRKVSRT